MRNHQGAETSVIPFQVLKIWAHGLQQLLRSLRRTLRDFASQILRKLQRSEFATCGRRGHPPRQIRAAEFEVLRRSVFPSTLANLHGNCWTLRLPSACDWRANFRIKHNHPHASVRFLLDRDQRFIDLFFNDVSPRAAKNR